MRLVDNMNYFFKSNGFSISDRSEIAQPKFSNIWVVSDEDYCCLALAQAGSRASTRW
ncbi:MAG: hypothetical protein H6Q71_2226 [Firmicutes bacterium]|nr:hypothetical protein [Bacillota bacterium]